MGGSHLTRGRREWPSQDAAPEGREQPPQGELHKILNLRDLYRAKLREVPTTNGRGFAPLRAPLTDGFTVRTAIEPHPSQSTQFNQSL